MLQPSFRSRRSSSRPARLPSDQRWELYRLLAAPRALLAYALVQVRPAAAHALADAPEVDARQDRVYAATVPALHCPGYGGRVLSGSGFYAGAVPQTWRAPPEPDVVAALAGTDVPALVIKGRCDYLDRASAVEYLDVFSDGRLVYLPDAGHDVYLDDPAAVVDAISAFLTGRPVPGVLADPRIPPAGYHGEDGP